MPSKFPRTILFIFLFASQLLPCWGAVDAEEIPIETLLQELDATIQQQNHYEQIRSLRADSLQRIANLRTGRERIQALQDLYGVYLHFQTDSTMAVLQRLKSLPEYESDEALRHHVQLDEAHVYGMMGFYATAFHLLRQIDLTGADDQLLLHYYNVQHSVLGWRSDQAKTIAPTLAPRMLHEAMAYHDSLLMFEPDSLNREIIRSNLEYDRGEYEVCIDHLHSILTATLTEDQRIYAYSRLSQAYGKIGNHEGQKRYLILTAIGDIRSGITEYMALPELSYLLQAEGDTHRAYNYLLCALDDANTSKANLRTIEVSKVFPIIERARQNYLDQQHANNRTINLLLSLLAVGLAVIVFVLLRFNRKLKAMRVLLAQANNDLRLSNQQLKQINHKVTQTDHIKGEYLTSYVTRSRRYLASLESFQRQMLKLLQTRQLEELQKQLKSTQMIEDEQEQFYNDFDETFLHLYPDFVQKFNALLRPECAILPKKGELLTTELRIFALIRMGETDSTRIAKFLNYSLTTIYNYRSRVRNNALGDKETFENDVMLID